VQRIFVVVNIYLLSKAEDHTIPPFIFLSTSKYCFLLFSKFILKPFIISIYLFFDLSIFEVCSCSTCKPNNKHFKFVMFRKMHFTFEVKLQIFFHFYITRIQMNIKNNNLIVAMKTMPIYKIIYDSSV